MTGSALAVLVLASSFTAGAGPAPDLGFPPIPVPLPQPAEVPPTAADGPDDPLDVLWSHRLDFAPGQAPLITIRLMEGREEIVFRAAGRGRIRARQGPAIEIPPGERFRVRSVDALPAVLAHRPLLGDERYVDRHRLEPLRRQWESRGVRVRRRTFGGIYGIAGRVVDNRHVALLADGDGSHGAARDFAEESLRRHGRGTPIFSEIVRRSSGRLEVRDSGGQVVALGESLVTLDVHGDSGFTIVDVEHDVGYAKHGFEDRDYRGRLHVTIDASGRLAAVLAVTLEELLRGLVPSEIPARSPLEALKAQAVTARSNVLAQIGTRHLTDPYLLCSEMHCQAYRGTAAQTPATDAAVRGTVGEVLFGRGDRRLVDGVYSAMCGGHGENNDAVWPTSPSASLRGRPDVARGGEGAWKEISTDAGLRSFLVAAPDAWCARAASAPRDRYRWQRRFAKGELDRLLASLRVGRVGSLEVIDRGVSGRGRKLRVTGDVGVALVEGELRIRRLLGNLPSSMFVVEREGDALVLRGGGWGHGVGMCQWGAIGRAEAGQGYREILGAYFGGAEIVRIY